MLLRLLFVLSLFVLMACSTGQTPPDSEPTVAPTAEPFSLDHAPYTVLAENLTVPWSIAFAPDGRFFLTERSGQIRTITPDGLDRAPWLSLEVRHQKLVGEGGLLGIAVDPDFQNNGYVYIAYTYGTKEKGYVNRLSRIQEDPILKRGGEETVLIDNIPGDRHHNGGAVKIGPDGKIYWTMGDAGKADLAQDTEEPNGTLLRVNRDGSVPDDNPIEGSYVYSYGHRNSQGLAWSLDGALYSTEHGPSGVGSNCCRDEVNQIIPDSNYGWPIIRGDQQQEGLVSPLVQSGSKITWAPAGITYVSEGEWKDSLLFVGLKGQALYRVVLSEDNRVEQYLHGKFGRLRDVQVGPEGKKIYILTSNRDGRLIFGGPKKTADIADDRVIVMDLP